MSVIKVGFDGLHRSGKGTQMSLLKKCLDTSLTQVISIRGEYYRKGNGSEDLLDPISKWWQDNWSDDSINYEKSQRINREINILFNKIVPQLSKDHGVAVLFDRTILSRHFLDSQHNENLSFKEVDSFTTKSGEIIKKIIPDIIFAFHCDKEVLLERLEYDDLSKDKQEYKRSIIERYADSFNNYLLNQIPSEVKDKVVIIDANKKSEDIHEEIVSHLHAYKNETGAN